MPERPPVLRFYGIPEIARALGVKRELVTVWRKRKSHGLPEPDGELIAGPIWLAETIEPWIQRTRVRLAYDSMDEQALSPELARRVVRRALRLIALLLEDEPRAKLVERALADLEHLRPQLERAAIEMGTGQPALRAIIDLLDHGRDAVSMLEMGETPSRGPFVRASLDLLDPLRELGGYGLER